MSVGKVDIVLLEDSSPLEWCCVLRLTRVAMAQFRSQRLLTAELVLDFTAMTVGFVYALEVLVLLVDALWCSELPLLLLWYLVHVWIGAVLLAICVRHDSLTLTKAFDERRSCYKSRCCKCASKGWSEWLS